MTTVGAEAIIRLQRCRSDSTSCRVDTIAVKAILGWAIAKFWSRLAELQHISVSYQLRGFYREVAVMTNARNVLGGELETCCTSPMTGFYRDGKCSTGAGDLGAHVVCAQVTEEFLAFTKSRGNDLSTPVPAFNFPGLKVGDRWCLCASRWKEALDAGVAPPVILSATHASALEYVSMAELKQHALDLA